MQVDHYVGYLLLQPGFNQNLILTFVNKIPIHLVTWQFVQQFLSYYITERCMQRLIGRHGTAKTYIFASILSVCYIITSKNTACLATRILKQYPVCYCEFYERFNYISKCIFSGVYEQFCGPRRK
jgi:hypothetical protein